VEVQCRVVVQIGFSWCRLYTKGLYITPHTTSTVGLNTMLHIQTTTSTVELYTMLHTRRRLLC
jgi:hypothetical protein